MSGVDAHGGSGVHPDGVEVLGEADIARALTRIAHEIVERNKGGSDLVVMGIPTRGVALAQRLAHRLASVDRSVDPQRVLGTLDVTMYRDDLHRQPPRTIGRTRVPEVGLDGKVVVLVDDVLFSGALFVRRLMRCRTLAAPRQCSWRR